MKTKNLFDIAHGDVMSKLQNDRLKQFLLSQRKEGRQGRISSIKTTLKELKRNQPTHTSSQEGTSSQEVTSSQSFSSNSGNVASDQDYEEPPEKKPKKSPRKKLINKDIASVLDRAKVSTRQAAMLMPTFAQSLNQDVSKAVISPATVWRTRQRAREEIAAEIKRTTNLTPPLVVHWDGKEVKSTSGEIFHTQLMLKSLKNYVFIYLFKTVHVNHKN